jgi:hypothetical protein
VRKAVSIILMPRTRLHRWIAAATCVLLVGCTPCDLVERTIHWEPSAFWWKSDRERSRATYRVWAEEAWSQDGVGCVADGCSGRDYKAGFMDGFVDFVFAGGTGEPPPLPPRTFWNLDLRLPAGRERANQWFAGYRHGSRVARESGYRALAQVQSSLCGPPVISPYGPHADGSAYPVQMDSRQMDGPVWPRAEELPSQGSPAAELVPDSVAPPQVNPPELTGKGSPPSDSTRSTTPAQPGQPVEKLERALRSEPAPEDIQLPSLKNQSPHDSIPATPREPNRNSDDSAARSRPFRLTSDPQFEW